MMYMVIRHTNADGIFTKASHPPGPFVPETDGPPQKSETAGLADATVLKATQYTNPLTKFNDSKIILASYNVLHILR